MTQKDKPDPVQLVPDVVEALKTENALDRTHELNDLLTRLGDGLTNEDLDITAAKVLLFQTYNWLRYVQMTGWKGSQSK